jgi:hypothetical protein
MSDYEKLRDALARIAGIANEAVNGNGALVNGNEPAQQAVPSCTLKFLPTELLVLAARTAVEINPVNAPLVTPLAAMTPGFAIDPLRAALVTTKYWGATPRRLSVSFLENTPSDLRQRIISHLNAWTKTGSIEFVETQEAGDVRISRGPGGYWSYLGTDVRHIPFDQPTMNLQGFTMSVSEAEFQRVVRHEAGHTLGMPHEHMRRELVARIDPERAYRYFRETQGWDKPTVDQQVLRSLDEGTLLGTATDQTSIMCYQLPATITRDGQPILGGVDINQTDFDFIGRIYPKPQLVNAPLNQESQPAYARVS